MLNVSPSLSWAEYTVAVLEDYMRRMARAGYGEVYRHGVLKKAVSIYEGKLRADREGTVPLNRPTDYQKVERRADKKKKKHSWVTKGGYTSSIIVPATPDSELAVEMRKVCVNISKMNPKCNFKIVEKGGLTIEKLLMNPNPTENNVCGRPKCIPCNKNPNQKKRICSRSNVLYNYECNEKDSCPDSTYDGQSSKNLYTRSLGHSYKYEKNHKDSFLHLHQEKAHNNEDENFKLSVTRFYGQDRLSCEIAEAVILRTRTGDVCNLKSEWHDPPLVQVTRRVQRGL